MKNRRITYYIFLKQGFTLWEKQKHIRLSLHRVENVGGLFLLTTNVLEENVMETINTVNCIKSFSVSLICIDNSKANNNLRRTAIHMANNKWMSFMHKSRCKSRDDTSIHLGEKLAKNVNGQLLKEKACKQHMLNILFKFNNVFSHVNGISPWGCLLNKFAMLSHCKVTIPPL